MTQVLISYRGRLLRTFNSPSMSTVAWSFLLSLHGDWRVIFLTEPMSNNTGRPQGEEFPYKRNNLPEVLP
ncbi:hypothetical protein EGCR1_02770 [Enterococcus gilvus]|nr:hypothetical protein EGCR1_02770 [Enterococcus gilvus]